MYTLQYLMSGHWRNVSNIPFFKYTSLKSAFGAASDSAKYFGLKYRVRQGIKVLKVFDPNHMYG